MIQSTPIASRSRDPVQSTPTREHPVSNHFLDRGLTNLRRFISDLTQYRSKIQLLATILVSEHIAQAREDQSPLFITALDVKRAFDLVDHNLLKFNLLPTIPDPKVWSITSSLISDSVSQVAVGGHLGRPIHNKAGVGQGGTLSPRLYKKQADNLLDLLEVLHLSPGFGTLGAGASTCADDTTLLAPSIFKQQNQIDLMTVNADMYRYIIHPKKTKIMAINSFEDPELYLRSDRVQVTDSLTILGVDYTADPKRQMETIHKHFNSARGTAYALMGAGLHGINGINPKASRNIIQLFVVPKLLYGLEVLVLSKKQIDQLEIYFKKLLKQIQSLPDNVADPASYLLIGLLPAEAYYDRNLIVMFSMVLQDPLLFKIAQRQFSQKNHNSSSWFMYAQRRLERYNIPSPMQCVAQNTDPKQ